MSKKTLKYLEVQATTVLPEPSELLAVSQIIEIVGITPGQMAEIMELEWINPIRTNEDEYLFRRVDVLKLEKLLRLVRDLEVSYIGASIIVDLMERVQELEKEIKELKELI